MKKLVCFDLDNTLLDQNSWYVLNLALGMTHEEDQKFLQDFKSGKINYEEWLDILLQIFLKSGKATKSYITEILSGYKLRPDAREVVEYLKSAGYEIVLISGSVDVLVDLVAKDLDIKYKMAVNEFVFDGSADLKDINTLGNDELAKLHLLEKFCQDFDFDIRECVCVGDGENDIELFRKTGHGITFKDSPIVHEAEHTILSLKDINGILK